jgi:signal peptidase II
VTKRQAGFWVVFVGMLALDQLVKAWVRGALPPHGSFGGRPFPGVFELTLIYNEGIAFGMLKGAGPLLAPIAVLIACGATYYSLKHPKEPVVTHVAMGLLAAGALGNLYDRVVSHQVTDMFWFRLINFPVFNVADSCITIATGLLILGWWGDASRQKSSETPIPERRSDAL